MAEKVNVYQMVTDRIIAKLKAGTIPWAKPWVTNGADIPVSYETQKAYRGINAWLLDAGEYATFNAIKKAGGQVNKGAKAYIVVYWNFIEKKVKDKDGKEKIEKIPMLRHYNVFNIATQTNLKPKRKPIELPTQAEIDDTDAKSLLTKYTDSPIVEHIEQDGAYYQPAIDKVTMPKVEQFKTKAEYYSTLFHELVHSTGHSNRLDRLKSTGFGTETYAKEELVAELGASMLCGMANIGEYVIDNSASYIQSWLNKLQNDNKFIISASSQAEKAVKYMIKESVAE